MSEAHANKHLDTKTIISFFKGARDSQGCRDGHFNNLEGCLEVLDLESFEGVSLNQLSDAITNKLPSDVSRMGTLTIYVMWLYPRLMAIDVSAEGSLTQEITTWYRFLKAMASHDDLIFEAFRNWQRHQAIADPTSSRRLSIAEAELRGLMASPSTSVNPGLSAAKPEALFGQMHPDRVKLSQEPRTVIEIDDDDDGGDDDVVFISSKTLPKGRGSSEGHGQNPQPGLPILTGPNMLAVKDLTTAPPKKKDSEVAETKRKLSAKYSDSSSASPRTEKGGTSKRPPQYYVCDRCGQQGHLLKKCPTNMDPSFDRKPPQNYKCHFCKKVGEHYGPLCPKHPHPDSIAAQRRAYAKTGGRVEGARRPDHMDRFQDKRAEPSQDGRESQYDIPARGTDRSSSPVREVGRHRYGDKYRPVDKYRPEDEFSRLSLSMPRDQRRKRKASRSPSPDKTVLRKKSQGLAIAGMANWSSKAATLSDNLMGRRDDDLIVQRGGQREGRLSYDDEVDEDVTQTRPPRRVTSAPVEQEGRLSYDDEVDEIVPHARPAKPVTFAPVEREERLSYGDENVPQTRLVKRVTFSSVVETMDVDKPEKIVLAKSMENRCDTDGQLSELNIMEMIRDEGAKTCHPLLVTLFEGYKKNWVNQTVNKARCRSADFYELCSGEEESFISADCEMVAETTSTTHEAEACVSDHEAIDSAMQQPDRLSSTEQEDTVMDEAWLAVPAMKASLTRIARGDPMVGFKPGEVVDAEATDSSLPSPADDNETDVEASATDEAAVDSVAKGVVDAQMVDIV